MSVPADESHLSGAPRAREARGRLMPDKTWKAFERRMSRDVGTERIPVTGERHGADAENAMFSFQFKLRRCIPAFIFEWMDGIVLTAQRRSKVGVLVLKTPRMRDEESLVVVRWKDWCDLHGPMRTPTPSKGRES
jgi:hypothetical protein